MMIVKNRYQSLLYLKIYLITNDTIINYSDNCSSVIITTIEIGEYKQRTSRLGSISNFWRNKSIMSYPNINNQNDNDNRYEYYIQ